MRITFHNHGGKGDRVAAALHAALHETVRDGGVVAVVDHDAYTEVCDTHDRVVLYPHGGEPILSWDGQPLHPHVRLNLVHAKGHAQVMEAYGFPVPSVPVGWCYSDLAEPRYPAEVRSVVFAPLHPLSNGYLPAEMAEANRRVLARLIDSGLEVAVRVWGSPRGFGLDPDAPVRWVPGGSLATGNVDEADLVVATGTVLHLAVARGVPALTFAADLRPDIGTTHPVHPARWDEYAALLRYPYDLDDGPLDALMAAVAQPDPAVADWRDRFVGEPFDSAMAVGLIEEIAGMTS